MAAVAEVQGDDGTRVTIVEVRGSFSEYTSACQYMARCPCGWTEQHILMAPLFTTAATHARDAHSNSAPRVH